ncbi:MAG: glycosyltransferase family 4 protein [Promethearchaeota archaeon]|jgi:glycosyltransferase involved in cell wall biosynthesis
MLKQNKILTKHTQSKSSTNHNTGRLLAVGPLPPPPDGPSVCFQIFCEEIKHWASLGDVRIIDSSPRRLKDEQTRKISAANFAQALRVLWPFYRQVISVDQVLIFASNGFLLSMAPLLLGIAKLAHKPCYLRSFGGSLDRYYTNMRPLFRQLLRLTLRHADGLIVETELLRNFFVDLIGDKVHLVPGYRSLPALDTAPLNSLGGSTEELRLVYLGHVREEKGVLVMLESLRNLEPGLGAAIHCDIFGPIYESFAARFEYELSKAPNTTYKGVLDPAAVISTLNNYDALVFPSYYQGEGHPGVLIEAMMAGIPVISTAFRSIPELIDNRVNGLLVAPQDSKSLAEAIKTIFHDRGLVIEMGRRNWERRTNYDAHQIVPHILQPLGMGIQSTVI